MQKDEMESLQSIFMDEFLLLNDENPITYELIVLAEPEDSADEYGVKARLRIEYTNRYPNEAPIISPHVQHPLAIKDLEKIREICDTTCASQIGMPMVYEVSEKVKDYLVERKKDVKKEMIEEEKVRADLKKSELDNRFKKTVFLDRNITSFTPVTVENYNKWRLKFEKEHEEQLAKIKPGDKKMVSAEEFDKRISGRQFFEMRKAKFQKKLEESKGGEAKGVKEGEDVFYYDEEAFEDVGDVEDVDLS